MPTSVDGFFDSYYDVPARRQRRCPVTDHTPWVETFFFGDPGSPLAWFSAHDCPAFIRGPRRSARSPIQSELSTKVSPDEDSPIVTGWRPLQDTPQRRSLPSIRYTTEYHTDQSLPDSTLVRAWEQTFALLPVRPEVRREGGTVGPDQLYLTPTSFLFSIPPARTLPRRDPQPAQSFVPVPLSLDIGSYLWESASPGPQRKVRAYRLEPATVPILWFIDQDMTYMMPWSFVPQRQTPTPRVRQPELSSYLASEPITTPDAAILTSATALPSADRRATRGRAHLAPIIDGPAQAPQVEAAWMSWHTPPQKPPLREWPTRQAESSASFSAESSAIANNLIVVSGPYFVLCGQIFIPGATIGTIEESP